METLRLVFQRTFLSEVFGGFKLISDWIVAMNGEQWIRKKNKLYLVRKRKDFNNIAVLTCLYIALQLWYLGLRLYLSSLLLSKLNSGLQRVCISKPDRLETTRNNSKQLSTRNWWMVKTSYLEIYISSIKMCQKF